MIAFNDATGSENGTRFTDRLREEAEPHWAAAVGHRFTRELADDVLDDAVFRRYLIQDYAFIDALTAHVGFAVGHAPSMVEKGRFAGFLGVLTNEEDTYFHRSFEALGVACAEWEAAAADDVTRALRALLAEAQAVGTYAAILATLLPVEWVYLSWATAQADKRPSRFYYAEWITLHTDPGFGDFVAWMRGELDRLGADLPQDDQAQLADLFRRACALEVQFFDAAYGPG